MTNELKEKVREMYIVQEIPPRTIAKKLKIDKEELNNYLKESNLFNERMKISRGKSKKTCIEKYGTENCMQSNNIKSKMKNTMIERYGAPTTMQSKILKEKAINTNLEKYGGQPAHSEKVVNKMKQTNLEKYGTECSLHNLEIKEKMFKNNLEKYNSKWHISSEVVKEKIMKTRREHFGDKYNNMEKMKQTNLEKYGVPYHCMTKECRQAVGTISKPNKDLSSFLKENNLESEFEFSIENKSYDLHILNTNILIEINPTYTHNCTKERWFNGHSRKPRDKYYHYNKTKLALENNYICIHKFDWQSNEGILELIKNINKYALKQGQPRLHWYNSKTRKHLRDFNESYNRQEMIDLGYVEIYDDGGIIW